MKKIWNVIIFVPKYIFSKIDDFFAWIVISAENEMWLKKEKQQKESR